MYTTGLSSALRCHVLLDTARLFCFNDLWWMLVVRHGCTSGCYVGCWPRNVARHLISALSGWKRCKGLTEYLVDIVYHRVKIVGWHWLCYLVTYVSVSKLYKLYEIDIYVQFAWLCPSLTYLHVFALWLIDLYAFACDACLPHPGSRFYIFVSPILHAILEDT